MPGIDELTVDRGLPAHCFEPDAVEKGGEQWMPVKGLIRSRDGACRPLEVVGERSVDVDPGADVDLPYALQRRENEVKALTLGDFTELYPLRFQCVA